MDRLVPRMQTIKFGLHIAQAALIFIAWVLTIVYFRTAFFYGADIGWYFALCFLSIPAIIYPTLTPRFRKSRKWGNPYAYAAVDVGFTILWLSAWASVASWNSAGACIGACGVSGGMIALGLFVFLLFGLTSAISVYGVIYFRQHGQLPGERVPNDASMIDPDREAFSTAPHDEYAAVHLNDKDDNHPSSLAEHSDEPRYDGSYGGGYVAPHVSEDTSYSSPSYATDSYSNTNYGGPSVEPPNDGRVRFPAANYT